VGLDRTAVEPSGRLDQLRYARIQVRGAGQVVKQALVDPERR
jgi:hypothetical protein